MLRKMYKRLTLVQLKELCIDRDIDHGNLRYKREFIHALEQYDVINDADADVYVENQSEKSAVAAQGELSFINEDEGDSSDEVASDVGPLAADEDANDGPSARPGDDADAVAVLRLRLQVAREERLANQELRRAREQERLTQEMTIARDAQRGIQPADDGARLHGAAAIEFRDIKAVLPSMQMGDDILTFLMSFERCLELNGVDRSLWARLLPAKLNQKALKIFARLSLEDSRCYDTVKRSILAGFKLNADSYLKTFRKIRRTGSMTYKAFLTQLRDVANNFYDAKGIDTFESLSHAVIMEQFLSSLTDNVRTFVESKQPETVDQAAEFADLHFQLSQIGRETRGAGMGPQQAHGLPPLRYNGSPQFGNQTFKGPAINGPRQPGRHDNSFRGARQPLTTPGRGYRPQNGTQYSGRPDSRGTRNGNTMFQTRGAYFATERLSNLHDEHIVNEQLLCSDACNVDYLNDDLYADVYAAKHCDNEYADECMTNSAFCGVRNDTDVIIPVYVNSRRTAAIRDSGCSAAVIIDEGLIQKGLIDHNNTVCCSGIFDEGRQYNLPTALVTISSPHFGKNDAVKVTAIVAKLPRNVQVIIGNRFFKQNPLLTDILSVRKQTRPQERNAPLGPVDVDPQNTDLEQGLIENAEKAPKAVNTEFSREICFKPVSADTQYIQPVHEIRELNHTCQGKGHDGLAAKSITERQDDIVSHMGLPLDSYDMGGQTDHTVTPQVERMTTDDGREGGNRTGDQSTTNMIGPTDNDREHAQVTTQVTTGGAAKRIESQDERDVISLPVNGTTASGADSCITVMTRSRYKQLTSGGEPIITSDSAKGPGMTEVNDASRDGETTETTKVDMSGRRTQGAASSDMNRAFNELTNIDISDLDEEKTQLLKDRNASDFAKAQRTDPTLKIAWIRADRSSNVFQVHNGLLYKRTKHESNTLDDFALVIPQSYRRDLLVSAHDSITSGHMGINKTRKRLLTYFYWPSINKDVANYVKRCKVCQLTTRVREKERAPLQPLPVLNAPPFTHLTIDVLGPDLPKTPRGNRYLLLICCNVSKYVQAYPLRNLKASTICDKLLHSFSLFGLPTTLSSDQMSSFKSQLITAVCQNFGINLNYSVVWHPLSHGIVERTIRTLEEMIRKFIHDNPSDWDKYIDFLLFAMRETTNTSTNFSAFEMVFGRKVTGPLCLQRQSWENGSFVDQKLKVPAAKYVHELAKKLQVTQAAARENVAKSQARMKRNYDKKSSIRSLKVGDLVLLLLPSSEKKISWQYMGPYPVTETLPNNNYRIFLGHRYGTYHINSLRKFLQDENEIDCSTCFSVVDDRIDTPLYETGKQDANKSINQQADQSVDRNPPQPAVDTTVRTTDGIYSDGMVTSTETDFVIGKQLTDIQRTQLTDLLSSFPDVFDPNPGMTDLITHKIQVTTPEPVWQPAYTIPDALRDKVEEELQLMLDAGIIQHDTQTKCNSPLIVIRKPDGRLRLVNNFVELNKRTKVEHYHMSDPTDILSRVGGATFLSKLDLNRYFFQIKLDPDSQHLTGFYTPWGTYSYKRLAMGLCGAPITAQKLIDIILRGAKRYASALLDDITVHSKTWEDHMSHLRDVLERIRAAGLTVNKAKCEFACNEMKLFGFIVSHGTIQCDPEKVEAIKNWKRPTNKSQLRSFIGTVNFFHRFIDHYATLAAPLTDLLPKRKPDKLLWTDKEQKSFEILKEKLISKPILRPPNPNKGYKIYCDGNSVAIAAVLMQTDDNLIDSYVVSYTSRKLTPAERRYAIVEIELMAIVYALKKFHQYVYLQEIEVFSDHRPLVWLNSLSKHSNRLMRWVIMLQDYNLKVTYIPGHKQLADGLTRTPEMVE